MRSLFSSDIFQISFAERYLSRYLEIRQSQMVSANKFIGRDGPDNGFLNLHDESNHGNDTKKKKGKKDPKA